MRDGINDTPESAVKRVAGLPVGDSYCTAVFIPTIRGITPTTIKETKQRLLGTMSKIVSRARTPGRNYRMHTIHSFTEHYDMIVAGLIVREEDDL